MRGSNTPGFRRCGLHVQRYATAVASASRTRRARAMTSHVVLKRRGDIDVKLTRPCNGGATPLPSRSAAGRHGGDMVKMSRLGIIVVAVTVVSVVAPMSALASGPPPNDDWATATPISAAPFTA